MAEWAFSVLANLAESNFRGGGGNKHQPLHISGGYTGGHVCSPLPSDQSLSDRVWILQVCRPARPKHTGMGGHHLAHANVIFFVLRRSLQLNPCQSKVIPKNHCHLRNLKEVRLRSKCSMGLSGYHRGRLDRTLELNLPQTYMHTIFAASSNVRNVRRGRSLPCYFPDKTSQEHGTPISCFSPIAGIPPPPALLTPQPIGVKPTSPIRMRIGNTHRAETRGWFWVGGWFVRGRVCER